MKPSNDSTKRHLAWFRPTIFTSKLLLVEADQPRNIFVGEVDYKDGGFVIKVRSRTALDDEVLWRKMCRDEIESMRLRIAEHVAKKLK